ncbi:carboxylesterase family protein [Streptomyces sp. NPDC059816]|uniref:carboxylesterase family protein n=1 Tax=Streptomyces sp. NPDC059816 TaxID=3346960 RepID=UPI0036577914
MNGSLRRILVATTLCGLAVAAGPPAGAVAAPGPDAATAAPTATTAPAAPTADCPAQPWVGGLRLATSVAPDDSRTSTVLHPRADGPKMQCGAKETTLRKDITYATVPGAGGQPRELKLDVLAPTTGGPRPLVVFLPGGGFVTANKSGSLGRRTHLAEQGYVVASVEYRTTRDEATYVDGVADAKAAIRFLRAHAAAYGIDPSEVAVFGESAGGYLASMVGTTGGVQRFDAGAHLDQSSRVRAVVNWYGLSDLAKLAADFDPATRAAHENSTDSAAVKYVLGPNDPTRLQDAPAAVAAADPATYAGPGDAAFTHFHGTDDRVVSPSQTVLLHHALLARGVPTARFALKDAGHGPVVPEGDTSARMWETQHVIRPLTAFLRWQLH